MQYITDFFDKVLFKLNYSKLNIIQTVIFNFRTMPLKVAFKFPVYLYGKVDMYLLKGKVLFKNCEIKKGMVRMGMNQEFLGTVKGASLIVLNSGSKLIFQGKSEFSSNFLIRTGKNAVLKIGEDTYFGSSVKVVCISNITIGKQTRIAFESQLINSDFHFTYNLDKKEVKPREKEIHIGSYNWIGNRTTISKGTVTNPYTIIASSSIVNKDYTKIEEEYAVLGGQPAKLIAKNIRRIYPLEIEKKLVRNFEDGLDSIPEELENEIYNSFKL